MKYIDNMNQRVKKMSIIDVKLAQGAAMFLVLIIVKLFPQIMGINIWWFVIALVACVIKPLQLELDRCITFLQINHCIFSIIFLKFLIFYKRNCKI